MKKIFSVILAVISVLISGCGSAENAEDYISSFDGEYTANISVDEDGTVYTARISKDGGTFDIVFAEPSVLWGMGYSFEGDDSFLIYNDMNIELDSGEFSNTSTGGVYRWYELLKCDGEFTVGADSVNGEKAVKLTSDNCDIYFDKETKKPLMLKSGKTVITFNEWNGKTTDAKTTDVSTN